MSSSATHPSQVPTETQRGPGEAGPVLLLTASVDPRGCAFTQRADPATRLRDYQDTLSRWIAARHFPRIVLCENSAWDLTAFADQRRAAQDHGVELELLGFDGQDFDRRLGKGYGELGIIAHACDHARLLAGVTTLVKVTGRYVVGNVTPLLDLLHREPADIVCDLRHHLTEADCRIFAATPAFLREDLLPLRPLADDSRGVFLEHLLARAAHLAMGRGRRWALMPMVPRITGIGGSYGQAHHASFSKVLRHLVKRRIIAH